uniref:PH domain-containing protein n=1 Tax=Palpitomonas bilix TaxID=652834 RepID=A0A7S3D5K0_9EUKA|mmetsp:Transcript_23207/g.58831  ORF Transcript_23207/g.58831 Transcript_23207/m.58831 type:complete len:144 (+) Transcript_23207:65-496(+)
MDSVQGVLQEILDGFVLEERLFVLNAGVLRCYKRSAVNYEDSDLLYALDLGKCDICVLKTSNGRQHYLEVTHERDRHCLLGNKKELGEWSALLSQNSQARKDKARNSTLVHRIAQAQQRWCEKDEEAFFGRDEEVERLLKEGH